MIGLRILDLARRWYPRGNTDPPEVCIANQYQTLDGMHCIFTTDGEPFVFGVGSTAPANQFVTIDDDIALYTTDGQPLVYMV